jgi:hypothetical protein
MITKDRKEKRSATDLSTIFTIRMFFYRCFLIMEECRRRLSLMVVSPVDYVDRLRAVQISNSLLGFTCSFPYLNYDGGVTCRFPNLKFLNWIPTASCGGGSSTGAEDGVGLIAL